MEREIRKYLSSSQDNFQQQTFLGCTVKDFNVNGGFGDSVSTLHVELVPDEYNKSDCKPLGLGDDIYHNGLRDIFNPPLPGSPVFFKFGPKFATIEKAYMPEYNLIYGTGLPVPDISGCPVIPETGVDCVDYIEPIPANMSGDLHFVFGGILQSYSTNSSTGGDPIYSVSVNDPREILSNVTLILNNYANTVFGLPNVLNIYGFLEYNPSESLRSLLDSFYAPSPYLYRKTLDAIGGVTYTNGLVNQPLLTDAYITSSFLQAITPNLIPTRFVRLGDFPGVFPYTGTSYSKRGEAGIPVYRVVQSIYALMGFFGPLPDEYRLKNFGGMINFRGYNYIVDLSGIPFFKLPPAYMINFDQMSLLEFCQEVCDTISHDLHITLLPIVKNHPVTAFINPNVVAGIIRVNAIDRSHKPAYGAITNFINVQKNLGINVTNTEVGLELSNIPTDKFVVGAQEVNMHFFTANEDSHRLDIRKVNILENTTYDIDKGIPEQWFISNSLRQQILPFYGFLGKDAVTIPRGYGPYQQILLDATGLNVNGVGNYYVATQMELRAALVSYEDWKNFLLQYNDIYMEEVKSDTINSAQFDPALVPNWAKKFINEGVLSDAHYAVSVPRCVFRSDRNYFIDGKPASSCSPPYGWPLYYKRSEMIGIPDKGLAGFIASSMNIISEVSKLANSKTTFKDDPNIKKILEDLIKDIHKMSADDQAVINELVDFIKSGDKESVVRILRGYNDFKFKQVTPSKALKRRQANAMKVYEFVKQAAQNLGVKWLVKMPKVANPFYDNNISLKGDLFRHTRVFEIQHGPYGFIPRDALGNISIAALEPVRSLIDSDNNGLFNTILSHGNGRSAYNTLNRRSILADIPIDITQGAIKTEYDFVKESYVFNYEPEPQGGYLHNDLYRNLLTSNIYSNNKWQQFRVLDNDNYPIALKNSFLPLDPAPLMNENRISSYVRFDNSQFLDLSSLPKESYSQTLVNNDFVMPDALLDLDNETEDKPPVDSDIDSTRRNRPKTCAFVRCELDARFYMPPRYTVIKDYFTGNSITDKGAIENPVAEFDPKTGEDSVKLPVYKPNYVPDAGYQLLDKCLQEDFVRTYDPVLNGEIVLTDPLNQDTNNIYALITLPGFVGTIVDRKYEQANDEATRTNSLLHVLMKDTVNKYVPGFLTPATRTLSDIKNRDYTDPGDTLRRELSRISKFDQNFNSQARREKYALSLLENYVMFPSPVGPDMAAIALRSNERCYGPWISSFIKLESRLYRNIPGKVEFVKDENLAPWNYGGYDLMNQAGTALAEFSSSILLYEEKGSVTVASLPVGNSLLRPLISGGPLVTNIDVRIGTDGVTTTYNMSTYSPRFGNLQKQRNDMISKIGRDRQRLLDDRNDYIRRGLGKSRAAFNDNFIGTNAISKAASSLYNSVQRQNYSQTLTYISPTNTIVSNVTDQNQSQENPIAHNDVPNDISVNNFSLATQNSNGPPPIIERG
jgi:hypothetical protein